MSHHKKQQYYITAEHTSDIKSHRNMPVVFARCMSLHNNNISITKIHGVSVTL